MKKTGCLEKNTNPYVSGQTTLKFKTNEAVRNTMFMLFTLLSQQYISIELEETNLCLRCLSNFINILHMN